VRISSGLDVYFSRWGEEVITTHQESKAEAEEEGVLEVDR